MPTQRTSDKRATEAPRGRGARAPAGRWGAAGRLPRRARTPTRRREHTAAVRYPFATVPMPRPRQHTHTHAPHDFVLFSRPTHRSSLTLRHHLISIRGNILIISSSPTHWRPHHLIIIHTLATGLITSHHSRPTSPTTRRPGGAHEAQRRPGGAHEAQRRPGGAHEAQRQPAPIPSTRGGRRHVAPRSPLARPLRAR